MTQIRSDGVTISNLFLKNSTSSRELSSFLLSMVLFVPTLQNRVQLRKIIMYFGSYS